MFGQRKHQLSRCFYHHLEFVIWTSFFLILCRSAGDCRETERCCRPFGRDRRLLLPSPWRAHAAAFLEEEWQKGECFQQLQEIITLAVHIVFVNCQSGNNPAIVARELMMNARLGRANAACHVTLSFACKLRFPFNDIRMNISRWESCVLSHLCPQDGIRWSALASRHS